MPPAVAGVPVELEIWHAPTPIPAPVLTAAGLYDTYFHLVVVARADGCDGWAYAALPTLADLERSASFARALVGEPPFRLATLLSCEHRGVDTASRAATCALSLAAWDLTGRLLGLGCADLWGRSSDVTRLACYGSGFFLDASRDALVAEAERYRAQRYRYVKMRVGIGVADDIERFEAVRAVFPEPGAIAVDAFHSWTAADVRAFVHAVGTDLLWVEDATPYDQMDAIRPPGAAFAPMASGESLETADELLALHRDGRLDYTLPDVMRLGGPHNWLAAAHALAGAGSRVGSHVFTPHSAHLLACVRDPLPVEVFDWSDPLFASVPAPDPEGFISIEGPGFGVELDHSVVVRHGTRVV